MPYLGFLSIALLLAGVSAIYLLYPLLSSKRAGFRERESEMTFNSLQLELSQAGEQRDYTYLALAELDQDYAAGELNEADYQVLRTSYKEQAIVNLVALDQIQSRQSRLDTEIEAAIKKARQALVARTKASPKNLKSKPVIEAFSSNDISNAPDPEQLARYCEKCGCKAGMRAIYCTRCGAKLSALKG